MSGHSLILSTRCSLFRRMYLSAFNWNEVIHKGTSDSFFLSRKKKNKLLSKFIERIEFSIEILNNLVIILPTIQTKATTTAFMRFIYTDSFDGNGLALNELVALLMLAHTYLLPVLMNM